MKAVILAGGKGTRLRPVTCEMPKPMVPVMNVPLMEYLIVLLKKHGIRDIGVTLMYLPQKIKAYFGDGSKWGVRLVYFMEDSPCGTAGSLLRAASFLDETFLVLSGDCITDINLTEAIEFHRRQGTLATIVLTRSGNPRDYGIVMTDSTGSIVSFLEKPSLSEVFSDIVNTGIYVLEPEVLHYIEADHPFDFSRELFPKLLGSGLRISGYTTSRYWSDVGSLENYLLTHRELFDKKADLFAWKKGFPHGVIAGQSTVIEPTAQIRAPCIIGDNCYIGHRTVINSYTVIGNNCVIEDHAIITRSILYNNVSVGSGSEVSGSILGSRARLMRYVSCLENVVIGDQSVIHERCIIKPGVRIWPGKTIEPLSVVDRSIIHSPRFRSSLLSNGRITGSIHGDITPELATRLGSAFGTVSGGAKRMIVSSDMAGASRLFEYALISGLISTGVQVFRLHNMPVPAARMAVHEQNMSGGVHIRSLSADSSRLEIDFLDATGANLGGSLEKSVEETFFREDYTRCPADAIPCIAVMEDFSQSHIQRLAAKVNTACIREKPPVLFIMSDSESMLRYIHAVFERLFIPIAGEMLADRLDPGKIQPVGHCLHADLTAFIDGAGEHLVLMDSCGRIPDENQHFLLRAYMLLKSYPGAEILAPLNMTCALEKMANQHGGTVKRTKTSGYDLVRELMKSKSQDARRQYLMCHDAVASLAKTIEFLCMSNLSLEELYPLIPSCNMVHSSFLCPYEAIGKIMRTLHSENGCPEQVPGGIQVGPDNSRVLIIPDSEKPVIHLYAEAHSGGEAGRLLREYSDRISLLLPVI